MAEAVAPYNRNPAFGEVYVAPTDAQAKAESAEGVVRHVKSVVSNGTGRYFGAVTAERDDNALSYDNLVGSTILHGSPETVIRKIEAFRAVGATSILLHYPPYYGPEKTSQMVRLFAKEVSPHVQALEAPRLAAE
jgi:alkanesulfonate monooxygenase SsuD/methylene tetrahydromethanopterin reductase-like flavin-dependent oxidoreductase (luciferase family)